MSLLRALSSANSGLAATSARADVAASNIANASNPNYVRKEVITTERFTDGHGNGVRIATVEQKQNLELTRQRRGADAAFGRSSVISAAHNELQSEVGEPGSGFGLFASIESLEASMNSLQATPESVALQNSVVQAAREITAEFNTLSKAATKMRETADQNIFNSVGKVNKALYRLQEINSEITDVKFSSGAGNALETERQLLLSEIGEIIPIRDIPRDNGQVDVVTDTGVFLLAGNVRELSFTRTSIIEPTNRYGTTGSTLSGLFVDGQDITPGTSGAQKIKGGSISGEFAVRDSIATEFTDSLDAMSRDLIDRFSNDSIDSTKPAGAQGLFTDATYAADATKTIGVASRIGINAAVDPNAGGAVYRIRDGIGATSPGNTGNTTIINGMISAMSASRSITFGGGLPGNYSVINAAAAFTSQVGEQALRHESINAGTIARRDILTDAELDAGSVDVDFELQTLIIIEQNYAANARVIQTVDQMIDRLLQI